MHLVKVSVQRLSHTMQRGGDMLPGCVLRCELSEALETTMLGKSELHVVMGMMTTSHAATIVGLRHEI